ncbi:MAG: tetratricopeptide repeat protein [Phycisphaerales bacterium]|nr:tetratricopeptide repeat protein [Phycisphaerales bacterium]
MPRLPHLAARWAIVLAAVACCGGLAACSSSGPRLAPGVIPAEQAQNLNEAVALAARGDKAMERGNTEDAIDLYRKSVRTYDGFAAAWNNLGVALMRQDDFAAAEEAFIQASLADPTDPRPRYNQGLLYLERGYPADARRHFGDALKADGNYIDAMLGAIRADVLLGAETDETLDLIRKALFRVRSDEQRLWLERNRLRIEESRAGTTYGA